MATLSSTELATLRNDCEKSILAGALALNYTKAQINASLQALENYFEATTRAGFGTAIENAAPGVFNANQKKRLAAFYIRQKCLREGV